MLTTHLIFTLLIAGSAPGSQARDERVGDLSKINGRIVSSITVIRHDVFDDKIGNNSRFYYRWGNKLHIKTREIIIRDELLFEVGDPVDSLMIIESQRNLRLRGFIGEADIDVVPNGPDSVDLIVTTMDYWTTKIAFFSELGGGDYMIGMSASEDNLLGNGQALEVSGQTGSDEDSYSIYVADGRIGGSRVAGSFFYTGTTYGDGLAAYLARPQYSLTVRTGFLARYRKTDGIRRLFSGGEEDFRYRRMVRGVYLKGVYSIGIARRLDLSAIYRYESIDYSPYYRYHPLNQTIPADETRSYPTLGIGVSFIVYDLQRFLDEAGTPEDLTLGASAGFSLGRSSPAFGADFTGTRQILGASFLARPSSRLFIGAGNNLSWWRHDGRFTEIRNRAEFMIYSKTGQAQVLCARWLTDYAWRQKSVYQIIVGGSNGLRGYRAYQFTGNRLALGNVEYRFYLPLEILTVRIGGAAFFDIGRAWEADERIELKDLKSDIGLGLRFGLTKSSTSRVLRLDVAKSLSSNDVFVSFATGMLFSLQSLIKND
jgi:hypothetical protein